MEKVLDLEEKYFGKYVALKNQDDATVVGAGNNPEEALQDAKKKGFQKPYLIYIPEKALELIH